MMANFSTKKNVNKKLNDGKFLNKKNVNKKLNDGKFLNMKIAAELSFKRGKKVYY